MVVNFRVHGISRSTSKLALILPMLIKKKKIGLSKIGFFFFLVCINLNHIQTVPELLNSIHET